MTFMAGKTCAAGLPLKISMFLKTSSARTGASMPSLESVRFGDEAPTEGSVDGAGFCCSDCHRREMEAASNTAMPMSLCTESPECVSRKGEPVPSLPRPVIAKMFHCEMGWLRRCRSAGAKAAQALNGAGVFTIELQGFPEIPDCLFLVAGGQI